MLGNNISLNKFKKVEIMSGISSDHNAMKLVEINYKKERANTANTWNINHDTNNLQVTEKKKNKKKYWESNENGNRTIQTVGDAVKHFQREACRDSSLPRKPEKSQINNLSSHLKELSKRANKIQSQQKERNNEDQSRNQ